MIQGLTQGILKYSNVYGLTFGNKYLDIKTIKTIDNYSSKFLATNTGKLSQTSTVLTNNNVYYNDSATFEDMLINSALVKFYGPSKTIDIITNNTGYNFVKYDQLINNKDYILHCMENIYQAVLNKQKIFGTTELRTSLQTEARNYTRQISTPFDKVYGTFDPSRVGRGSDIFYWFTNLGPKFVDFYRKKPTMEESFNFLTSIRGIGNYYGYHFSTNLARMPGIGVKTLLKEHSKYGNLDEDSDFVAPGVGSMQTIIWLFENTNIKVNTKFGANFLRYVRNNQDDFFNFKGINKDIVKIVTETGRYTTFGCEIGFCQFNVFICKST